MSTILTYIQAIPRSFYSRKLYQDAFSRWTGVGAAYLITVILLVNIFVTLSYSGMIKDILTPEDGEGTLPAELAFIINQIPTVTLNAGVASTEQKNSYIIVRQDGSPLFAIDTSTTPSTAKELEVSALFTQNNLVLVEANNQENNIPIPQLLKMLELAPEETHTLDKNKLVSIAHQAVNMRDRLPLFIYAFHSSVTLFMQVLNILLFACLATFLGQFMKIKISFPAGLRLSALSATPHIIIFSISQATLQPFFSNPETVYFIMHGMFLYHGVESCKRAQRETA